MTREQLKQRRYKRILIATILVGLAIIYILIR